MAGVAVVTDTTQYIPSEVIERHGIHLVSLYVNWDGRTDRESDLRDYDDFNFLYLYRREIFDGMPIESDGVFMCTEVLVRAIDNGARVAKVTAECLPRRVGVSSCFRAPVIEKTFGEMLRFWWRRRRTMNAATP